MKLPIRRVVLALSVAGCAALASPACVDSQSIIFVRQVQARVLTGNCTVDNSPSSLSLLGGTLDVAFREEYNAALLVGNQLVPRGNSSQLRTETSRVEIQGAVVRLLDSQGAVVWGPRTVPGSGFIDPAQGSNASYGVTDTILLGAEYGQQLNAQLAGKRGVVRHFTAIVKVFGETLGGINVESGEWQYPLDVCWACLISFPIEANDPRMVPTPNCDAAATTGLSIASPCAVGQDENIDCRVCKQFHPNEALCEPPVP